MKKIAMLRLSALVVAVAGSMMTMSFKPFATPHHQTGSPLTCQETSLPAGCSTMNLPFTCKGTSMETIFQKDDCTLPYKRLTAN